MPLRRRGGTQVPRAKLINYGAVRGPPLPRRRRRLRLSPPPATSGAPGESVGKALPVADVTSGLTKAARRPPRGLRPGRLPPPPARCRERAAVRASARRPAALRGHGLARPRARGAGATLQRRAGPGRRAPRIGRAVVTPGAVPRSLGRAPRGAGEGHDPMRIALFDYGAGNLHSLGKALEGAGAEVTVTVEVGSRHRPGAVGLMGALAVEVGHAQSPSRQDPGVRQSKGWCWQNHHRDQSGHSTCRDRRARAADRSGPAGQCHHGFRSRQDRSGAEHL